MNRIYLGIFCWILLLQPVKLFPQYFDDDAAIWLKVELEKKVTNNLVIQLTTQCRINNNVSQIGQLAADIGLRYKLNKHLKLMADYVYREAQLLDGNYLSIHQFYTGVIFKQQFQRFTFRYRLRLQTRFKEDEIASEVIWPASVIRNKFTLKYELTKLWDIYTAYELSSPLYNPASLYFNRSRTYVGAAYQLNKSSTIETYFMLQRRYTYNNQPARDFVYGVNYVYTF